MYKASVLELSLGTCIVLYMSSDCILSQQVTGLSENHLYENLNLVIDCETNDHLILFRLSG